jgi:hypothetical protein
MSELEGGAYSAKKVSVGPDGPATMSHPSLQRMASVSNEVEIEAEAHDGDQVIIHSSNELL